MKGASIYSWYAIFRHSINRLMTWNKHRCRFSKMIRGDEPKPWGVLLETIYST